MTARAPTETPLHDVNLDNLRTTPAHPPATPPAPPADRATRFARFNRLPTTGAPPTLAAPVSRARARPRRSRRLAVLLGLAVVVIAGLVGLLIFLQQQNEALARQVAALDHNIATMNDNMSTLGETAAQHASRESELAKVLSLQKDKLAGQATQIQNTGQDLQSMQRELQDLRDRMARLDQHNAALRDALGLGGVDSPAPAPPVTSTLTATPGPSGALPPAEGGETGPLYPLDALVTGPFPTPPAGSGDVLTDLRAQLADASHRLDVYEQIENNLSDFAAQRVQEWAQTDEDDSNTAPPDIVAPPPEVGAEAPAPAPAPSGGRAGGRAPAARVPAPVTIYHIPSGFPHYGAISSGFGWRSSPFVRGQVGFHKGIDIVAPTGTPVYATQAGRVVIAGWSNVYGRMVMLDHGAGWTTIYGHNSRLVVSVGDDVVQGQLLAYSGSTGMSTGPHIHYEIRYNGVPVNPMKYR